MMSQKPVVVIQMGLPPEALRVSQGEPGDWFTRALEMAAEDVWVIHPERGESLPDLDAFSVAIITGSWAMVTDHLDWSERTAAWARSLIMADKPLLGVCYGHQLMAAAMGGVVDYNPKGRELGTFPVTLTAAGQKDPLAGGLPSPFMAHLSHAQSVLTAPARAVILAGTAHDPHQILRYGPNVLSCQFHPEFTPDILRICMEGHRKNAGGIAPLTTMPENIPDTPLTRGLLQQFVGSRVGRSATV
ncbi:MAG TPA: glutamine amidotransferase [Castellaniella sp.]|uniref:glutamine amidotransferase n=1 Tax=Castellaniella sp. TaxID=1955812 RepID=UPI002EF2CB52